MDDKPSDDKDGGEDAARRRDEAKNRAPKAPPKPRNPYLDKSAPPPRRERKGSTGKGR